MNVQMHLALLSPSPSAILSPPVSKSPAMMPPPVLSLNLRTVGADLMKLSKLPVVDPTSPVATVTPLLPLSSTQLKLCPLSHQLSYLVHLSIHQISTTSITPMPQSRTLFIHHSISKCTTTCGFLLLFSLTIRPCASSLMSPTLTPTLPNRLPSLFPLLPFQLTLLSHILAPTLRLFLFLQPPLLLSLLPLNHLLIASFMCPTNLPTHFVPAGT